MRRCPVCGGRTNNQEELYGRWRYIHSYCADNPDPMEEDDE